jgi:hypothetical protein
LAAILLAALAVVHSPQAAAQVVFDNVTNGSGVEYTGESYGAAWGDMNGDGRPDLFVNHHRNRSGLYINQGNGKFVNRQGDIDAWQATPRSDVHGGTWADYNNDGRRDLVITAGSKNYTQFLVNDGTTLVDRIHDFGFDKMSWGGRLPFWFDYDNDGLLDLGVVVQADKIQLHRQSGGIFTRQNFASGHLCTDGDYSLLMDMTQDGRLDWICVNANALPQRIYDLSAGTPFVDRTDLAIPVPNITDVAIADFDGDQVMELFAMRGRVRVNGASVVGPASIEAQFANSKSQASWLTYKSAGDLSIELHWSGPNVNLVYIGASGKHPPAAPTGEPIRMQLSASDPNVVGLKSYDPATDRGIFVGYDPATATWTYVHSAGGISNASETYSFLESSAPVSDLKLFGIPANQKPIKPALLKYDGSKYTNQIAGTGLDRLESCVSVAAADFDNDMDVDLYYVCRDAVLNLANRLYLNDGSGRFTAAAAPFGAEGPTGAGVGLGENVVASDFDVDGFVDLFVTNGLLLFPEEPYGYGGADKLFRNRGNTRQWLELDLAGTISNRDGIGAIVTVTAGGKTQRRDQNGGYHRWAQHDTRLHFGLGPNTTAKVTIQWPSGQVSTFTGVASNHLYEAVEGAGALVVKTPGTSPPPAPVCSKISGVPAYNRATEQALFIWRDGCSSNRWNVRVTGGAGPSYRFSGRINSGASMSNLSGFSIEANDLLALSNSDRLLDFGMTVAAGAQDGFSVTVDPSVGTCFGRNANVSVVYGGSARTPLTLPFDLQTLEPC